MAAGGILDWDMPVMKAVLSVFLVYFALYALFGLLLETARLDSLRFDVRKLRQAAIRLRQEYSLQPGATQVSEGFLSGLLGRFILPDQIAVLIRGMEFGTSLVCLSP